MNKSINEYTLRPSFGMGDAASAIMESLKKDEEFVNESLADVLRPATLAVLLAVPGLVDADTLKKGLDADGKNKIVQVDEPSTQKKIYNIVGKDKYNDFVITNIIARTLMAEAVGEKSPYSFDAVASVIWNRAGGDKSKFVDVILEPRQFASWKGLTEAEKENFTVRPHGSAVTNPSAWKYCVHLANLMVNGKFEPVNTWNAFYAHGVVTPAWAANMTNKKTLNKHTFGNIKLSTRTGGNYTKNTKNTKDNGIKA